MRNIPVVSTVHNVEMKTSRSAGTFRWYLRSDVARDGAYASPCVCVLRMRKVEADCRATPGRSWQC